MGGGERAERIWRCSCGGSHFVSVSRFADEETVYLHVEEYPVAGHWGRLRACFDLLRGRRHTWYEVLLTPEQAGQVARELTYPQERQA
jgi:hypothetical protein